MTIQELINIIKRYTNRATIIIELGLITVIVPKNIGCREYRGLCHAIEYNKPINFMFVCKDELKWYQNIFKKIKVKEGK